MDEDDDPSTWPDDLQQYEDGPRPPKQQRRRNPREADDNKDYRLPGLPRYVRINTLKISLKAANREIHNAGYHLCPDPTHPGKRSYYRDETVPDLMVFKPKGKSDISRLPLVKTGEVVVQQKASCFPALALAPPPGSVVIDGCAAPGNKTSHLAALMQNRGEVYAFERDERRCELLRQMMERKGASIVEAVHASFLDADPNDPRYARVTHILLDPSCSSSGMSKTPEKDPAAIRELADAQLELVLHAMRFPALQELCYSTCSVYDEENERVVAAVLEAQASRGKHARRFELTHALPAWPRRGRELEGLEPALARQLAQRVVRTAYPDDGTIGFFLAKFVRAGAAAAPPSAELQTKLDALARARGKAGKAGKRGKRGKPAVPPPGAPRPAAVANAADTAPDAPAAPAALAAPAAPAALAAPAAPREVPAWRKERDERLKRQKQNKKQRTQ